MFELNQAVIKVRNGEWIRDGELATIIQVDLSDKGFTYHLQSVKTDFVEWVREDAIRAATREEAALVGQEQPHLATPIPSAMRTFETGATRSSEVGKLDFEGFLSPLVLERYAEYLNKHRVQADGQMRESDNWQKGMPRAAYIKSAFRHFVAFWKEHRGFQTQDGMEDAACAVLFNVMGYLHETLREKQCQGGGEEKKA